MSELKVLHVDAGSPAGGAFDLRYTEFADCGHTAPCFPVPYPAIRMWEWDNFMGANSGCEPQDAAGSEWLVNAAVDLGLAVPRGLWVCHGSSFVGDHIDECPAQAGPPGPVGEV